MWWSGTAQIKGNKFGISYDVTRNMVSLWPNMGNLAPILWLNMSEYGKWWVTLNLLGLLLVSPIAPLKMGDPWVLDGFPRKVHFGADFTSADQVLRIHIRCVAAVAPQIVQICTVWFKGNPWKSKFVQNYHFEVSICTIHVYMYVLHELVSKPFDFFKYQSLVRSMGVCLFPSSHTGQFDQEITRTTLLHVLHGLGKRRWWGLPTNNLIIKQILWKQMYIR